MFYILYSVSSITNIQCPAEDFYSVPTWKNVQDCDRNPVPVWAHVSLVLLLLPIFNISILTLTHIQ